MNTIQQNKEWNLDLGVVDPASYDSQDEDDTADADVEDDDAD